MSESPESMDWQQEFIATNLLAIGYNAWAGYLSGERGTTICSTSSPAVGIAGESFQTYFIWRSRHPDSPSSSDHRISKPIA